MSGKSPYRSVNDYSSADELRRALMSMRRPDSTGGGDRGVEPEDTSSGGGDNDDEKGEESTLDWLLQMYDRDTTEPQSMRQELARLTTLHSYLILDAEKEESFDRLTGLLSRMYNVPIALVSLVDLGRQWFMSNRGLGDVRETARADAFCSHAINTKTGLLVVPDTLLDRRFVNNKLVRGPPFIRFYAGASLISPEGYKLGTLCIIDSDPRPDGLTKIEEENLRDLAAVAMKTMVDRRQQYREANHQQFVAQTAHDLLTPLTAVQLSLSLLKEDTSVLSRLSHHEAELLRTAFNCSEIMTRICRHNVKTYGRPSDRSPLQENDGAEEERALVIHELVAAINTVVDPMPKTVPLYLSVDRECPPVFASDDLKIFRSCLNLLMNALQRTDRGFVAFRIRKSSNDQRLIFECEDTGPNVMADDTNFFDRVGEGGIGLGLSSIATQVGSLGGRYGCRLRHVEQGSHLASSHSRFSPQGAVFWFDVPLKFVDPRREITPSALFQTSAIVPPAIAVASSEPSFSETRFSGKKRKLSNPIMTGTIQGSCDSAIGCRISSLSELGDIRKRKEEMLLGSSSDKRNAEWGSTSTLRTTSSPNSINRALVVDDSLVVRKSLGRALERLGFTVSFAEDGLEGLQKLKETVFDITLLDFLMPNLDGIDCVKQYRQWEGQNRPDTRQLIIGISAHADGKDQRKGMDSGMDGFQAKPLAFKTLATLTGRESSLLRSQDAVAPQSGQDQKKPARQQPVVLIASDVPTARGSAVDVFDRHGWKVEVVNDGASCLKELQKRNWNFVMIDDDLPDMSGVLCVNSFREWEKANRVQSQKHVFLVAEDSYSMSSEARIYTQPPHGFNGVLSKPIPWDDLKSLIAKSEMDRKMDIIVR